MLTELLHQLQSHGGGVILGAVLAGLISLFIARWKRYCDRKNVLRGDARDTVVINQLHDAILF